MIDRVESFRWVRVLYVAISQYVRRELVFLYEAWTCYTLTYMSELGWLTFPYQKIMINISLQTRKPIISKIPYKINFHIIAVYWRNDDKIKIWCDRPYHEGFRWVRGYCTTCYPFPIVFFSKIRITNIRSINT